MALPFAIPWRALLLSSGGLPAPDNCPGAAAPEHFPRCGDLLKLQPTQYFSGRLGFGVSFARVVDEVTAVAAVHALET